MYLTSSNDHNEKIIIFVGSDFSRKGLDRAILGMSYLSKQNVSAMLLVIGDDSKEPYKKIIKEQSLEDKVIFFRSKNRCSFSYEVIRSISSSC